MRRTLAAVVAAAVVAGCGGGGGGPRPRPAGPLYATMSATSPVDLAVIGDFGSGDAPEEEVARAVHRWSRRHPLEALVTTGDNVYESGHPSEFEQAWEGPYGWVGRNRIPVIASLGNHDVETEGGAPVMRLLDMPWRWYARRLGPVGLVVLDGNSPADPEQISFLSSALRRSTAPWQVAVFHQPPFSCGHHGSAPLIRTLWLPIFEAGDVDVALSGHDHNYQRFPPVRGIRYLVSGGGGQELHEVNDESCPDGTPEPVAWQDEDHHFLHLRATETTLRIWAIAVPGLRVVDTFTLRCSEEPRKAGARLPPC